jgi:hypothetical protein
VRLFRPLNSLVVDRNLCIILLSKIGEFSSLVKHTTKFFKILRITYLCFTFLALVVAELSANDFSQNESYKTYLGQMLPPGNRIWLLI